MAQKKPITNYNGENRELSLRDSISDSIFNRKMGFFLVSGGAASSPFALGMEAGTSVGVFGLRVVATTNFLTRLRRIAFTTTAATAGLITSFRCNNNQQFTTGTGMQGLGGFNSSWRFAIADAATVAGARFFCGFSNNGALPTNVQPNTLLNCFGIAQLSTDATQLYLVYGGSTAQTAIPLGVGFPPMNGVGANNGIAYEFSVDCPSDLNGIVNWKLERLDTFTTISGTITPTTPGVQTPANTIFLLPSIWRTNNATALAVTFEFINFYIETEF